MSQFADQFAEMGLPALFEQHGEPITYTIGGASGASITAAISEIEGPEEQGQHLTNKVERLQVILGKDPNDTTYGGVERPRTGDKLTRAGDSNPFAFSGRFLQGDAGCWTVEFWRARPGTIGRT